MTTLGPTPADAVADRSPASAAAPLPDTLATAGRQAVEVLALRLDPGLPLPGYARPLDAGADLVTAEDVTLAPGERALVKTGLAIALPAGYAAFVHPRSGLAARHGLSVVNAPGTVDAGYRGEIKVILINTDRTEPIRLSRGDRIAQLVVQRVEHAVFREVDELPASGRGDGGFGSTGVAGGLVDVVDVADVVDVVATDGTGRAGVLGGPR